MTITILALAFVIVQTGQATVRGRVVDSVTGASLQRVLVAQVSRIFEQMVPIRPSGES